MRAAWPPAYGQRPSAADRWRGGRHPFKWRPADPRPLLPRLSKAPSPVSAGRNRRPAIAEPSSSSSSPGRFRPPLAAPTPPLHQPHHRAHFPSTLVVIPFAGAEIHSARRRVATVRRATSPSSTAFRASAAFKLCATGSASSPRSSRTHPRRASGPERGDRRPRRRPCPPPEHHRRRRRSTSTAPPPPPRSSPG